MHDLERVKFYFCQVCRWYNQKEYQANKFFIASKLELNKVWSTCEFGWPKHLFHTWFLFLTTLQARESKEKWGLFVEGEMCWEKSRPILGPFAIIFQDTWSYTTQPEQEKWTLQSWSTNWRTKIRFVDRQGDMKTSIKEEEISPTAPIGRELPSTMWIFRFTS